MLGAQYRQKEINPIDYCIDALEINIDNIPSKSSEYAILKDYIDKSNHGYNIQNIFKVQRKGEPERILQWESIPNHYLLFHGSKVFNFIGILHSGLRKAPPEAPVTGYMFGKGVYFADMFSKSIDYCDYWDFDDDLNHVKRRHRYMLLCEVALGKMYDCNNFSSSFDQELKFLNGIWFFIF